MIEIVIIWVWKFQVPEADIVQSLIIDTEGLVCVLEKLVYWEDCIVRFNNYLRNLKEKFVDGWMTFNYRIKVLNDKCLYMYMYIMILSDKQTIEGFQCLIYIGPRYNNHHIKNMFPTVNYM